LSYYYAGSRPTPQALVQARSDRQSATGKLRNPSTVAYQQRAREMGGVLLKQSCIL